MSEANPPSSAAVIHRLTRLRGRDPHESERASTPLELLFDLTFVVAVGIAAERLAEISAEGHIGSAVGGFVFAMFAICVAWISYTWFASAFDTDDWLYRVLTMVVMVGVVVFAVGLPPMFHSLDEGHHIDNRLMVIGYIIMRIGLVALWIRVARDSPEHRHVAVRNITWTLIIQVGWVLVAFIGMSLWLTIVCAVILGTFELLIPVFAQGRASGTPWHPHHIAERYGLLAIITLGEGVVGTVASSQGLLGGETGTHWSVDAVAVLVVGVGLTFGMWWVYFLTPFGTILQLRPRRGYLFGYGHILIVSAIAATGGALHLLGLYLEHHSEITERTAVLMLAVPVALYLAGVYALHDLLLSGRDGVHLLLLAGTAVFLVAGVVVAAAHGPIAVSLLLIMCAPFVSVIGFEGGAFRSQEAMIDRIKAQAEQGR